MGILSCLAPGQSRELGALERVTITVLGVACTAMMLPIVLGVEAERNLVMYLFLAAMMTIAFLTTTGGVYRPLGRSWFAWGLSALTWASCLYFIAMHSQHELAPAHAPAEPLARLFPTAYRRRAQVPLLNKGAEGK